MSGICHSEKIAAFVDDELEPSVRAAVEQHLRECERCAGDLRAHRAFMRELESALSDRLDLEVPPNFAKVVAVHAENDMRGVRDRAEHRRALRYCIVLSLVTFALLGVASSRALLSSLQSVFRASLGVIGLFGKTLYDALAGFSVVFRVFKRGLVTDSNLAALGFFVLFLLAIGFLTLLISRYHRTRVLD